VSKQLSRIGLVAFLLWIGPALSHGLVGRSAVAGQSEAKADSAKASQSATKTADVKKDDKSKAADKLSFMRVARDSHDRPIALEIATGHYVSTQGKPITVDLIGAIHIGDTSYYKMLNERFRTYDKVLFELVMPENVRKESLRGLGSRPSNHPVGMLQQSLPGLLDLDYQLKGIDYTAKNFEHADLSPDAMGKAIRARGDNGASVTIRVIFDLLSQSQRLANAESKKGGEFGELQLLSAMFDSNRPLALKKMFAEQMDVLGGMGTGLGSTLDTILVQDRNAAAMKVLKKEVENGTPKIAIFYGAAHMPDFDRRLTEDLKFKRASMTWDRAWDLRSK
jgi:hypothetical protein